MGNVGVQPGFETVQLFQAGGFGQGQAAVELEAVNAQDQADDQNEVEGLRPTVPVPGRANGNIEGDAFFIPDAVAVGGYDAEGVTAGVEVCVTGRSLRAYLPPLLIVIIQFYLVPVIRRVFVVQSGIVEGEVILPVLEFYFPSNRDMLLQRRIPPDGQGSPNTSIFVNISLGETAILLTAWWMFGVSGRMT